MSVLFLNYACTMQEPMSVDKKLSTRFTFTQKLLLMGGLVLILAFSAWRFSLFDADRIAVRVEFRIDNQAQVPGFEIEDLRFYVHKLELHGSNGQVFPIQLKTTRASKDIALVDLSRESAMVIHGWVPRVVQSANIHSLGFRLGVPFASNHANPLKAQEPLNESGMFWVWQQGYKFFKLDFLAESGQDISYHMGSAGCESASALRPPSLACNYPNRAQIVLAVTDIQAPVIQVNPWPVLEAMQKRKVQLCSATANISIACSKAMKLFGINPLTGLCDEACSGQEVFSLNSRISARVASDV